MTIRKGATSIASFDLCPRRWAFGAANFAVVDGAYRWLAPEASTGPGELVALPAPASPSQARGSAVHGAIERYYRGTPLDTRTDAGLIAMAGIHHLPTPRPDLWVERPWSLPLGRHEVTGTFDLVDPGVRLYDHKTTGDLVWAKTPEQLREDTQAILYTWALGEERLAAQWTYFRAVKPYTSRPVSAVIHVREERLRRMERTLDAMQAAEGCDPIRDLPAVPSACGAFGGCPYQSRCALPLKTRVGAMIDARMRPEGERVNTMAKQFATYEEARAYAEQQTRDLKQPHGIAAPSAYVWGAGGPPKDGSYSVMMLPRPENRFGFELRVEAVEVPPTKEETMSNVAAMKAAMQGFNPPPPNGAPPPPDPGVPLTPYSPDLPHNPARTMWFDAASWKAYGAKAPNNAWFPVPIVIGAPPSDLPPPPPEEAAGAAGAPPTDPRAEALATKLGGTAAPGTSMSPAGTSVVAGAVSLPPPPPEEAAPAPKRGPGRPRKEKASMMEVKSEVVGTPIEAPFLPEPAPVVERDVKPLTSEDYARIVDNAGATALAAAGVQACSAAVATLRATAAALRAQAAAIDAAVTALGG